MLVPEAFIRLFNNGNPELIAYASKMLRVYAAVLFLMGAQLACQQTFIAIGNAKTSFFLACLRKIILLIPLIYILPRLHCKRKDLQKFLQKRCLQLYFR